MKERFQELETYKDVTTKQLETIQRYLSIILRECESHVNLCQSISPQEVLSHLQVKIKTWQIRILTKIVN